MPFTLANFRQLVDEAIVERGRTMAGAGAEEVASPTRRGRRPGREERIRAALASLSREELYELLVGQALDDRSLGQRLLTRYGLEDADRAGYRQLVQKALALGQGHHGFLDYRGAAAGQAIWGILDRADRSLVAEQLAEAIAIYWTVIEEVVPAMAHADDSMGSLGDCVQVALAEMAEAAGDSRPGRGRSVCLLLSGSAEGGVRGLGLVLGSGEGGCRAGGNTGAAGRALCHSGPSDRPGGG